MDLDPDMQLVLDWLTGQAGAATSAWDVEHRRRMMRERSGWLGGPPEPVAEVQDFAVSSPGREIPVRLYDPTGFPDQPLVLFSHGGCWVAGDLETHDGLCRALAHRGGCLVLAVDYRLAPEHPFPAALEDMESVLAYLLTRPRLATWDRGRIALAGDSAGGALAAALAHRHRDAGLSAQMLIYPILDSAMHTASYERYGRGLTLSAEEMAWCWGLYCPDVRLRDTGDAAPLRASDVTGLPRTAIVIAEYDVLVDEARDYARRLQQADVPVETLLGKGLTHGFLRMGAHVRAAAELLDQSGAFLRRAFSGEGVR